MIFRQFNVKECWSHDKRFLCVIFAIHSEFENASHAEISRRYSAK